MNGNFKKDLKDGKDIELEVFKLLNCEGIVTQGKFGYDIIINKDNATRTIEVKYSRCPDKYIAFEVFNYYTMEASCIAVSKADYWVNVIAEPEDRSRISVWVAHTQKLKEGIRELYKSGKAIASKGGDYNGFAYINVLIDDVKSLSKGIGFIIK